MNLLTSIANPFYGNLGIARQVSRLFFPRQYNIGGVDLDTVIDEGHEHEMTITNYPVETGMNLSDHVTQQPKRVVIRGLLSDINANEFIDFGIIGQAREMFGDRNSRSSALWQQLADVQQKKTLLLISTNLQSYPSMIIVSLSTHQDKDTVGAVFFTATLQELQQINIEQHESKFEAKDPVSETAKENAPTAKRMSEKVKTGVKKPIELPPDASALWKSVAISP